MAVTSANGWSANDRSVIASYALPGGKLALRKGDVSVVLLWCANRWHETVEPLVWPGNWGYAERLIRGSSTTLSNHASGTAIDLNAPQHPLGTDPRANFTAAQINAVRRLVAYCEGAVRWGGDYSRPDGMHLEINAGAAAVRRIADKIRAGSGATPEGFLMALSDAEQREVLDGIRKMKPGQPLPARSPNCNPKLDDHYGSSLNAWAEAANARQVAEQILRRLPTTGTGPATLSDTDVARVAAAVLDELARRTAG